MTKDESAAVEFFARRRGVFCNSLPTPEGHLVFLGGDLKSFDLYGEAMFYLSPSLQPFSVGSSTGFHRGG